MWEGMVGVGGTSEEESNWASLPRGDCMCLGFTRNQEADTQSEGSHQLDRDVPKSRNLAHSLGSPSH